MPLQLFLKPCQMMSGNRQLTVALFILIVNQDDQHDEHQNLTFNLNFFNHNIWLNK